MEIDKSVKEGESESSRKAGRHSVDKKYDYSSETTLNGEKI